MTNNDIIQALKLCLTRTDCCFGCPMLDNATSDTDECQRGLAESVIDFINSQSAEIESLKGIIKDISESTNEVKTEAIEQFVKMLESRLIQMCRDEDANIPYPFTFIDELVKEYENNIKTNSMEENDDEANS